MSGVKLLLDTNIVIGLLKGYEPAVQLVQSSGSHLAESAMSQITRMELLGFPGITPAEEHVMQTFLHATTVIAIDHEVEKQAIALRRQHSIKLPDAIIAATALVKNLRLLTLDQALVQVLRRAGYSL